MPEVRMSDPTGPSTPAGWYPDPYGRAEHRYWDGSRWTDHVASAGSQAVDPVDAAAAASATNPLPAVESSEPPSAAWSAQPAGKSGRVRGLWTRFRGMPRGGQVAAVAIIAVIVVVIAIAAASGSGSSPKATGREATHVTTPENLSSSTTERRSTTTTTQAPTTTTTTPPETFNGGGDDVVRLTTTGARIVTANYAGSGNFVVKALDASNQENDLLVNTIGAYQGTTPLDFGDSQTVALQVNASGPWSIVVRDAIAAPSFTGSTSGHGDAVLISQGPSGVATISHDGHDNFVVKTVTRSGGEDLLVNEIGAYSGRQPWPDGPAFVEITADGNWTINIG